MGAIFTTVGSAVMTAIGAITGRLWPWWPPLSPERCLSVNLGACQRILWRCGGRAESGIWPVGELFTPLKPVFDWLGEKYRPRGSGLKT